MHAPDLRALAGAGLIAGALLAGSFGSALAAPISAATTPSATPAAGQSPAAQHPRGAFGLRSLLFGAFRPIAQLFRITTTDLRAQLASGKTLSQIAASYGKSVMDVENTVTAALKARLDRRVAVGKLTAANETTILANAAPRIQTLATTNLASALHRTTRAQGSHRHGNRPSQPTPTPQPTATPAS